MICSSFERIDLNQADGAHMALEDFVPYDNKRRSGGLRVALEAALN